MVLSQFTQPIIVIGGGTFGTSTAYHLSTKGYTDVTILDCFPVPSFEAAGNDINKIVRTEYPEPLYTKLASDARDIWRDPNGLFAGLYNPSGWIIGATDRSMPFVEASMKSAKALGVDPPKLSFWSPNAAWVNAREGIVRMAQKAIDAGVRYVSGSAGYAKQVLYDENQACVGVKCADGTAYFGSKIILTAGAAAGSLLDLENQIVAKGHAVGHIQLTPDEIEEYKDMPILDHLEGGILFPPQEDGIMKIGAVHFVTNYAKSFIEAQLRKWMKTCVPKLAHREWVETRICWDGDMADYHFLITPHSRHKNLNIAIGGSAHGFKFLPVLGKYIVEMMEGTLDPEIAKKWRWRPGLELSDYTTNPHPEKPEDLNDMPGWGPVKSSL
ncbi:hypothetical protein BDW72DRAFT_200896 [Aspergillus terricola var. indicus]